MLLLCSRCSVQQVGFELKGSEQTKSEGETTHGRVTEDCMDDKTAREKVGFVIEVYDTRRTLSFVGSTGRSLAR